MNKRIKKKQNDKHKKYARMKCASLDAINAACTSIASNERSKSLSILTKRRNTARVRSEAYIKITKNPFLSKYIQKRMERERIKIALNSVYGCGNGNYDKELFRKFSKMSYQLLK